MREYLAERFGSEQDAAERLAGVAAEAAQTGIPYDPAAMRVAPNTRLAHRAVTLARDQGFETQALDALYLAHFAEGLDVTDFAVVVERLADAGLPDPPALAARLAEGDGEEDVAEDELIAAQIGARAVPLVVAGRRIVLQGARESGVYGRFLAHAIDAAPPA
jgi:predicted DsbA family dithiol-disulfide isomerase